VTPRDDAGISENKGKIPAEGERNKNTRSIPPLRGFVRGAEVLRPEIPFQWKRSRQGCQKEGRDLEAPRGGGNPWGTQTKPHATSYKKCRLLVESAVKELPYRGKRARRVLVSLQIREMGRGILGHWAQVRRTWRRENTRARTNGRERDRLSGTTSNKCSDRNWLQCWVPPLRNSGKARVKEGGQRGLKTLRGRLQNHRRGICREDAEGVT